MIRTISKDMVLPVSRQVAFDYLTDHHRVADWMFGVSAFEPVGEVVGAAGDEFDAAISIGALTLRSRLRVTNWSAGESLSLRSVRGIESHSALRISDSPVDLSRCVVAAQLSYRLPRGAAGLGVRRAAEPFARLAVRKTEQNISRKVQQWCDVAMSQ